MAGKKVDLVPFTQNYKGHLHHFYLNLKQWRSFQTSHNLAWQKFRFTRTNRSLAPKERGIYVFTIELFPGQLPEHGYILYIGITGNNSPTRTLHSRYADYLGDLKSEKGRPLIRYSLRNWQGDVFFNYVALPDTSIDLHKIEQAFLNAIIPPLNTADFSAEIREAIAAAF